MANNEYINKVEYGNDTLMDITDTTAETEDVIGGKVFYAKSGARSTGTLGDATQSTHGLMSTADKIKLDNLGDEYKAVEGTNIEPYLFRQTDSAAANCEWANKELVGGTICWNQLVQNGNFIDTSAWGVTGTLTVSNNVGTFSPSYTGAQLKDTETKYINGHKYLIKIKNITPNNCKAVVYLPDGNRTINDGSSLSNYCTINNCTINPTATYFFMYAAGYTSGCTITVENIQFFDLTQMFGATIADYIYGLEQATEGAGVAWFQNLFPKSYYAYDAGSLQSVQTGSHVIRGFNQLSNVKIKNDTNRYSAILYGECNLFPNTTYCLSFVGMNGQLFYTNENLFDFKVITCTGDRQYITITTKAQLSKDNMGQYTSNYGWILLKNHTDQSSAPSFTNVCLNFHQDGERDGEYESYSEHSYLMDSDLVLRGMLKLDSNNKLYYDGDTYEANGTVTRKYGIVDLGTLGWTLVTKTDRYNRFYTSDLRNVIEPSTSASVAANLICKNYVSSAWTATYAQTTDKIMGLIYKGSINDGYLSIVDSAYQSAESFTTAMSGVYLIYELATPVTELASPFHNPQAISEYGTEEFIDTRDVAIPVGHHTIYYGSRLGAQFESDTLLSERIDQTLKDIAPTECVKATTNHPIGDIFIANDKLLIATASIATNDTITIGTNVSVINVMDYINNKYKIASLAETQAIINEYGVIT